MQTVLRYLLMLRHIPKQPQKIDVNTLRERLTEQGIDVSVRTIQRNLVELSEVFPLTTDERCKPFGWSLLADAPLLPLASNGSAARRTNGNGSLHSNGLSGETVEIELECDLALQPQLEAYPLNKSQKLTAGADTFTLTADAELSTELLVWILSHGAQIEVIAPASLRTEVAQHAEAMYRYYFDQ
ncbi:WYL domain-containing protein [Pseudidiomarina sp. CB1]|uniref:WYL domain-containing protein n=1 Tax=Pseudidiomarina sp. CB1 TaxID=2972484 RepID=UPI002161B6CD|nr:WYL domain-containing protein [Pseudidiomarina sp. CB1]